MVCRKSLVNRAILVTLLCVVGAWLAAPISVNGAAPGMALLSDDDLFSSEEDGLFLLDLDDLFLLDEDTLFGSGQDLLVESDGTSEAALEEVFLVNRGVDVGGVYRMNVNSVWTWAPDVSGLPGGGGPGGGGPGVGGPAAGPSGVEHKISADAAGTLFLDARPNRNFRAFAKIKGDAAWTNDRFASRVKLHELFSDFVIGDRAFVRLGKQTINWGVGYFFSPADIVNIGRIDPENPEAEREGPMALRVNVPWGRNNLYAYATVERGSSGHRWVALAPKVEVVLGGSEIGLGMYYRADRAPRAMGTVSTTVGRVSLFGEVVLSKGADKRFVRKTTITPTNPDGLEVVTDSETLYAHATVGARYTYSDPDGRYTVTGAGQYYFNGEGYDGGFIKENQLGLVPLMISGQLAAADLQSPGRHYAALSVSGTSARLKDVSPSAFWLGNLSDGSGMFSVSLRYTGWKHFRPGVSINRTYGDTGSEYAPGGPVTILTVGVTVGRDM